MTLKGKYINIKKEGEAEYKRNQEVFHCLYNLPDCCLCCCCEAELGVLYGHLGQGEGRHS